MSKATGSTPVARGQMLRIGSGWGWRGSCGALLLAGVLAVAGCGREGKRGTRAHLVVINESDHAWRLVLASGKGRARELDIESRQTLAAEVPAGDYEVEQVLLTPEGRPADARRVSVRLERGQDYRWRLATLRSVAP